MSLSQLPSKLPFIAWCIVISAAIGAVYALTANPGFGDQLPQQQVALWAVSRVGLTGAVISGLLMSLEIFLLDGALAAPLRRLPFHAHVTIQTLVYLAVVLFALTLGGRAAIVGDA